MIWVNEIMFILRNVIASEAKQSRNNYELTAHK